MSLKEIRERIHSARSIMQITSAMKMVSASKLKKSKDIIFHINKYLVKIIKIWSIIIHTSLYLPFLPFKPFKPFKLSKKRPILIIIIGSNKGLCGAFNTYIYKYIINNYCKYKSHIITIGKKIKNLLINKFHIYRDYSDLFNDICYNNISRFCKLFIYDFLKGNFNSVHLIYNRIKTNTSIQELIREKILPIKETLCFNKNSYYLFDPAINFIINKVTYKNIKIHLYKAIFASYIAEHSSRMIAMHQSADNASKLKKNLILIYNKDRQSAITKEIIEIMSGFSEFI